MVSDTFLPSARASAVCCAVSGKVSAGCTEVLRINLYLSMKSLFCHENSRRHKNYGKQALRNHLSWMYRRRRALSLFICACACMYFWITTRKKKNIPKVILMEIIMEFMAEKRARIDCENGIIIYYLSRRRANESTTHRNTFTFVGSCGSCKLNGCVRVRQIEWNGR